MTQTKQTSTQSSSEATQQFSSQFPSNPWQSRSSPLEREFYGENVGQVQQQLIISQSGGGVSASRDQQQAVSSVGFDLLKLSRQAQRQQVLILKFSRYYLNLCLKTKNTSFMHQMFFSTEFLFH